MIFKSKSMVSKHQCMRDTNVLYAPYTVYIVLMQDNAYVIHPIFKTLCDLCMQVQRRTWTQVLQKGRNDGFLKRRLLFILYSCVVNTNLPLWGTEEILGPLCLTSPCGYHGNPNTMGKQGTKTRRKYSDSFVTAHRRATWLCVVRRTRDTVTSQDGGRRLYLYQMPNPASSNYC